MSHAPTAEPVVEIDGLKIGFGSGDRVNPVVWGVDLELTPGRIVGLVGESGSGKSTTALATMGYLAAGGRALGGSVRFRGRELLGLAASDLRDLWGKSLAYISQNAALALNPALSVGRQIEETLAIHLGLDAQERRDRAVELLTAVSLPEPAAALTRRPATFSGGQQQRIALALALACRPEVLILDEPTTGLDATTQAAVSSTIRELVTEWGVAALFVSHDLALLANVADEILVMYAGEIMEHGPMAPMLAEPWHPYSQALLKAAPNAAGKMLRGLPGSPPPGAITDRCPFFERCPVGDAQCTTGPIAELQVAPGRGARCVRPAPIASATGTDADLVLPDASVGVPVLALEEVICSFETQAGPLTAVDRISLALQEREMFGLVGESGSGKSTLLLAIAGLHPQMRGEVSFRGERLSTDVRGRPRKLRSQIQLVFQNPDSSLNPRHTVGAIIGRSLRLFRDDVGRSAEGAAIADLLEQVRLPARLAARYPSELSGGERQRVALARAFAAEPAVLLCDEVTSSLDVSVQAAIVELLVGLATERGTAVLFVSHDLALVRSCATRVMVLLDGVVCDQGPTERVFERPEHEYTAALLAATAVDVGASAAPDPIRPA